MDKGRIRTTDKTATTLRLLAVRLSVAVAVPRALKTGYPEAPEGADRRLPRAGMEQPIKETMVVLATVGATTIGQEVAAAGPGKQVKMR